MGDALPDTLPDLSTSAKTPSSKFNQPSKRLAGIKGANVWNEVYEWTASSPIQPIANLGQGFIEYNPPQFLIDAHKEALNDLGCNQYGPPAGLPVFKQALSDTYSPLYGRKIDPDKNICVGTGGTEAILASIMAFIEAGDEVIIIEPVFELYNYLVEFVGGVIKTAILRPPSNVHTETVSADEWTLDLREMEALVTPKTKMFILNTPHNPTGKVFSSEELLFISTFCTRHSLILLSDEVYHRLAYDIPTPSYPRLQSLSDETWQHSLTVGSIGKSFNATGWRVGYVIGPEELIESVLLAHTLLAYTTAGPAQKAAAVGLRKAEEEGFWDQNRKDMQARLQRFTSVLDEIGLPYTTPQSIYFVFVSTRKIYIPTSYNFPRSIANRSRDVKLAWWLIREFGVVVIPGCAFYHNAQSHLGENFVRFIICKTDEQIELAMERLRGVKGFVRDEFRAKL